MNVSTSGVVSVLVGTTLIGLLPIMIGSDDRGVDSRDLLINLGDEIPGFAEGFPRVAELVTSDESCRNLSRKRYATYRDQGHELNTHKL